MTIKEIDEITFNEFAKNHTLKNFFQTKEYGSLMLNSDFSVMYIGAYENNNLVGASLILHKVLSAGIKYGYAPRGFLVDYYDTELLKRFTKEIKDFFNKKRFAFIKINPEIAYATLDYVNRTKTVNHMNKELIATLKSIGYDKLKDNLYFESVLPKYTPVIYLPNYDFDSLDTEMIQNLRNDELSGISLKNGTQEDIDLFYEYIKYKETRPIDFYKKFYEKFKPSDKVDLLMLELDYSNYVKFLQKQFAYEQTKNDKLNYEFRENPNDNDLYNRKMASDQKLSDISYEIEFTNNKMIDNQEKEYLGGAFVIKHEGRVTIFIAGNNKQFRGIDLKTYMFYKIIKEYKESNYLYLDMYGITADMDDDNPYKELNEFKLKFKPTVFEYIGEFDLIVNKPLHQFLWSTNKIQREFYKPRVKKQ